MRHINFVKEGSDWYVNEPQYLHQGGRKEDCLMVARAPEFIELFARGRTSLHLSVSEHCIPDCEAVLVRLNHGVPSAPYLRRDSWGWYAAEYFGKLPDFQPGDTIPPVLTSMIIGLCPVNAWFFDGCHPEVIWVKPYLEFVCGTPFVNPGLV